MGTWHVDHGDNKVCNGRTSHLHAVQCQTVIGRSGHWSTSALIHRCLPHCWRVSHVAPACHPRGQRQTSSRTSHPHVVQPLRQTATVSREGVEFVLLYSIYNVFDTRFGLPMACLGGVDHSYMHARHQEAHQRRLRLTAGSSTLKRGISETADAPGCGIRPKDSP